MMGAEAARAAQREDLDASLKALSLKVARAGGADADGGREEAGPRPGTTPSVATENFKFSNRRLAVKGLVCWALLAFAWTGVWVATTEDASDGVEGRSRLQHFKVFGLVLSVLLLLPSLFEMGFTWLVLIGDQESNTVSLLARVREYSLAGYCARGLMHSVVAVVTSLPFFLIISMSLPRRILGRPKRSGETPEEVRMWWGAFARLFGLLPDAILTWSLFPLSYFVIIKGSNSAIEVITNLVAVQVFAALDDLIVQSLLSPTDGLQNLFFLYRGDASSAPSMPENKPASTPTDA